MREPQPGGPRGELQQANAEHDKPADLEPGRG